MYSASAMAAKTVKSTCIAHCSTFPPASFHPSGVKNQRFFPEFIPHSSGLLKTVCYYCSIGSIA
jgi:hypothetical protein